MGVIARIIMGISNKASEKRREGEEGWSGLPAAVEAVMLEGVSGKEGFGLLDLSTWAMRVLSVVWGRGSSSFKVFYMKVNPNLSTSSKAITRASPPSFQCQDVHAK